jgi:hypothetical protein
LQIPRFGDKEPLSFAGGEIVRKDELFDVASQRDESGETN